MSKIQDQGKNLTPQERGQLNQKLRCRVNSPYPNWLVESDLCVVASGMSEFHAREIVRRWNAFKEPEFSKEFLHDVFVTAIEGGGYGVGSWADISVYRWSHGKPDYEPDRDGFKAVVRDNEDDKAIDHVIDAGVIEKGCKAILDRSCTFGGQPWQGRSDLDHAIVSQDAGELDAISADMIVQAGLFGDVVYG